MYEIFQEQFTKPIKHTLCLLNSHYALQHASRTSQRVMQFKTNVVHHSPTTEHLLNITYFTTSSSFVLKISYFHLLNMFVRWGEYNCLIYMQNMRPIKYYPTLYISSAPPIKWQFFRCLLSYFSQSVRQRKGNEKFTHSSFHTLMRV